jgi:mRNA interferase HigB
MVIFSYGTLKKFYKKYPDSEEALNIWYGCVKRSDWSNYHEMKEMFNSVDAVGNDRFVFNVRGNKYRIVAMIFFDVRTVYIHFIGLHKDYENIDCSTI